MSLPIGVVVIGRDEGERLKRCLGSVVSPGRPVIYVDSGSRDDSVRFARSLGVYVVELDSALPFTMARARNSGFEALVAAHDEVAAVQFVDGDCEVDAGWIGRAAEYLAANARCAAVTGFRRERHPEVSVWNRIIDLEWRGPAGVIAACGGDVLMRRRPFEAAGGFRSEMIAGEEPELCARLRLAGYEIVRLDTPMTLHDADMHRFGQWWRRAQRAGHAYAEGASLQGQSPLRHNVRAVRSIITWGLVLPLLWLAAMAAATAVAPAGVPAVALGLPMLLGLQVFRVARGARGLSDVPAHTWTYGASCVFAKFPQALGAIRYWRSRGRARTLIEYR